ncbi:MAG TPA: glycosyltransferase family 39 protein [Mycobacteriales bacterium]|nr:glycosyltransferase family 39 protein [Mycobacteriales bacterium]
MTALELAPLDISLDGPRPAPPDPRRGLVRRVAGWLLGHKVDVALVTVLTLVGALVHAIGMTGSPARFDDEGTYTAYAWAVQNWHTLGHYTYWYAHPPLGWLQISAWTWVTDGFDRAPYAVAAVRELMFVAKLVSIVLLYGLGRRLGFGRLGAAAAVAIFALSPLAVYFTRAALLDNIVTPWLLAAFFFAASPRRSVAAAVASAASFAVAVLTKETALLYLPALVLLLWQHTDRRNRRFTLGLFGATFTVLCAGYPLYAVLKNELLIGEGHVSLLWAVRWQLFERTGSGSIFDPGSTAHAVLHSWLVQDSWLPKLALAAVVPGLLIRRTRAVAAAFAIQVAQLLRGGYLPYPYVIAMIPFAALTVGGVLGWLWHPGGAGWMAVRWAAIPWAAVRRGWRACLVVACVAAVVVVGQAWRPALADLRTNDRDAGKAQALAWVRANVPTSAYVVVDDAYWVDLVRAGYPADHVIWFTKLDVDKDVKLPGSPPWKGIDYLLLDQQDDLSLHVQADGKPSKDTLRLFLTVGEALRHARPVARFGVGLDSVSIRQVVP